VCSGPVVSYSMISDVTATKLASQTVTNVCSATATNGEIAALFACALHETGFGSGWKGAGAGSYNQGAVQCGKWAGRRFVYVDTHPNADGTSTSYSACFRAYANDQAGWDDLGRIMYTGRRTGVREAAMREDWLGVSEQMHATGYYEGFGKTVADRIANHARAMAKGVNRALAVLGAGSIVVPPAAPVELTRVLELGCIGEDVKRAQRELKLAADGIFGKFTRAATVAYQTQHRLIGDGRIGPVTWKIMLTDDYVPVAAQSAP